MNGTGQQLTESEVHEPQLSRTANHCDSENDQNQAIDGLLVITHRSLANLNEHPSLSPWSFHIESDSFQDGSGGCFARRGLLSISQAEINVRASARGQYGMVISRIPVDTA